MLQPQSCVKGETFRRVGIENMDKSVSRYGDAKRIARACMCSQPQLAIAIAFSSGKEKENAAARRIRHVDHSAVIHRNRLWMLQTVFLKREQRLSPRSEFMNETCSGVRNKDVAERVRGDARRILQLSWPIALRTPLADIFERETQRPLL